VTNDKRKSLVIDGVLKCGCDYVENGNNLMNEGDLVLGDLVCCQQENLTGI
jgi:hypothetical protein